MSKFINAIGMDIDTATASKISRSFFGCFKLFVVKESKAESTNIMVYEISSYNHDIIFKKNKISVQVDYTSKESFCRSLEKIAEFLFSISEWRSEIEMFDELSTILKWLTSIFEINSKRQPVFLKEAKFRLEMKFMDLMKPSISKEMIKLSCKKRKAV